MNSMIEWFGKTVGGYVASSPRNALWLLKAGYAVNALQLSFFRTGAFYLIKDMQQLHAARLSDDRSAGRIDRLW
jgi:hypothetical protein